MINIRHKVYNTNRVKKRMRSKEINKILTLASGNWYIHTKSKKIKKAKLFNAMN